MSNPTLLEQLGPYAAVVGTLAGVGGGAWLASRFQRRTEHGSWLLSQRQETYSGMVRATHSFADTFRVLVEAAARGAAEAEKTEMHDVMRGAAAKLGEAASMIVVVGPADLAEQAEAVHEAAGRIISESNSRAKLDAAVTVAESAQDWPPWSAFGRVANDFFASARRVIETPR